MGAAPAFMNKPSALLGSKPKPKPAEPKPAAPAAAPAAAASNGPAAAAAAPAAAPAAKPAAASGQWDEVAKKKAASLLSEFFTVLDLNEALLCVEEIGSKASHDVSVRFVEHAATLALEGGKERECVEVGRLFNHLHAKGALAPNAASGEPALTAGMLSLAEQLDDLALDVPQAPRFLGEWLGGAVAAGAADFKAVEAACAFSYDGARRRAVLLPALKAIAAGEKATKGSLAEALRAAGASDLVKVVTEDGQAAEVAKQRLEEDLKKASLSLDVLTL
eukprot:TRINITY_DN47243_c0_g1_i1.p2 TRINITY_DN47243_c0_g1~~TRINITY_DN47243_c0_g1_i1.p2  ORF type:complete len:321 (+),score=38.72 TRINITY_DN47243_c0_g1_i1:134-964(+)